MGEQQVIGNELVIRVLGPAELRLGEVPLARSVFEKARVLLAYLAEHPDRRHRRETLASLFWPDAGPSDARTNLRKAIQVLKRALDDGGPPFLLVDRETVAVNPQRKIRIDSRTFAGTSSACNTYPGSPACPNCLDHMETAAELYRGPYLDRFEPEGEELQEWVNERRQASHRHASALFHRLSVCWGELGAPTKAITWAERSIRHEPWDEPGHRRLMQLLSDHGLAPAAIRHYRAFAENLQLELGTAPEPATQRLFESLTQAGTRSQPSSATATGKREKQQMAVLACEIAPRTPLDPEKLAEVIDEFAQRAKSTIGNAGGYYLVPQGRRLLAYFGYPRPRQDATRAALRCGLALLSQLPPQLSCRSAVHAGTALVDDSAGVPDPFGLVSGIALDVAHAIPAGSIGVTAEGKRLVESYFHFEPMGVLDDSLPNDQVSYWRVTGETGIHDRADPHDRRLRLVGRTRELAAIRSAWSAVEETGRGRALAIRGEPGLGKSRLLRAFCEALDPAPLEGRCFEDTQGTTLHPFGEVTAQVVHLHKDQSRSTQCRQLRSALKEMGFERPDDLEVFEALSGLIPAPTMDSSQFRFRAQDLLLGLLAALSRRQPRVIVLEDLHWADPTSLDLLAQLVPRIEQFPVLLLLSYRPEFTPPWPAGSATVVEPERLGAAEVEQMVCQFTPEMTPATVEKVTELSGGVPLFVEEITRALLEDGWYVGIPATLSELMQFRLQHLGSAKELAQIAAALGREFEADLLAAVAELDAEALAGRIGPLLRSGLWYAGQQENRKTYRFKHALVQEAAYGSLPDSERRAVHERIARVLEADGDGGHRPEKLARHCDLLPIFRTR